MLRMAQNQICIDFIKINIIYHIHSTLYTPVEKFLLCPFAFLCRRYCRKTIGFSQFGDFLAEAVGATSKFSVNKKRNTQYSVEMHQKSSIISLNRICIADFS